MTTLRPHDASAKGRPARALLLGALLVLGCAKGSPSAKDPASSEPTQATNAPSGSAAQPPAPKELTLSDLGADLPEAPSTCPAAGPLPTERKPCEGALGALAAGLVTSGSGADAALANLETCSEIPAGMVRALRAERLPSCADVLAHPVVGAGARADQVDAQARELLVALGLAGRLSRLVGAPPETRAQSSKAELEHYLAEHLFPWATKQAAAIGEMSRAGASMRGYARGIVAIEAALADLRFVEMARGLPLPVEMKEPEIQAEYYGALDQALEPRKDRARDAALVGLGELSALGILESPRLAQARQVIARVFAGNRIVALDVLLVPPTAVCSSKTPEETVAALVEAPYAAALLSAAPLSAPLQACLLKRGLSEGVRRRLEEDGSPTSRAALARAYFELGRTYMQAGAFQRAAELYAKNAAEPSAQVSPEDQLLGALSTVLSAAPESAVDLFRLGPRLPSALGRIAPLEPLAASRQPFAGAAAFDAAYLLELTAPDGSASHFLDVAKRYDAAKNKLGGSERALASDRARAARATATALERQLQ